MNKRAGQYRSNLTGEMAYSSYLPRPLPPVPPVELSADLVSLLVKANAALSSLNSIAARIPDMALFVYMYVRKEALMSSQIEGTQATLEDVLDPLPERNANRDVGDVLRYARATDFAIGRLEKLPLCNRLLRETHAVLMQGVRGGEKAPGEFRNSQNWIGPRGCSLKTASYVPPSPPDMVEAMSDLEKYINDDHDDLDPLIRAALIHYQFETIHPFLDGNGRIGRLLITLFLMEKKILDTPALYISYFLKKNRVEYYDRMTEVRFKGRFEQWIAFFLKAVLECADDAIATIDELAALHDRNMGVIAAMGRAAGNAGRVFSHLERHPIMEIPQTAQTLGLSYNTVASAVKRLVEQGILSPSSGNARNRRFLYTAYLDLLRKGT